MLFNGKLHKKPIKRNRDTSKMVQKRKKEKKKNKKVKIKAFWKVN
jgi:hypothetical protein